MAIKTTDYIIENLTEDIIITGKNYNTLYFKEKTLTEAVKSFDIDGNNLKITTNNDKTITITDYYKYNVNHSIKYIKTDESGQTGYLRNIIDEGLVSNPNEINESLDKKSANGTQFNDTINFSDYEVTNNKGLTINSYSGNDVITGTKGNDVINSGGGMTQYTLARVMIQ